MQTDKEAFMEFARGVVIGIGIASVFVACCALTVALIGEPEPSEKFAVVDHYGTCAVVKYNPPQRAESVYFLDCREVR